MNTHDHSHHHLGHTLFIIGIFLALFIMTLFAPANNLVGRAIGVEPIIDLSNQARSQHDQPPLTPHTLLMTAAQQKAEDMVKKRYFAHFAPDNKTPWDFFKDAGYSYQVAGENLAITNEDEAAVIKGWLNSPTHKENLLSSQYRDIGIGVASYGDYQGNKNTIVVVALYGTQAQQLGVTGTEPTNPAGTVAALRPALVGNKLYALGGIAVALIIAGAALEIRHIKRHTI